MYRKILLAADGSEHSFRAAKEARTLVDPKKGKVDIVYVVSGSSSRQDVLHHASKEEMDYARKEKVRGIAELFEDEGISCTIHVLRGEPGPTIVDFANKGEYECLVIGSRGLNNLQTMVLGSVSHKVAKRVECPVMIVK
ncbi:universal stress protein [Alkalihalophilus marmarensis]|uniref:universal stress protein n=1 Tax=Alkalihalophilus marmarensis TaxID=521377 RepID=UPI002DBB6820|nr:universal stress protein [Alkalihalophilus marmarensis]MEC2072687.1 universal stress protein [Alkalihalophilus marmarensis]